jgi:hypothetical protein
VGRGLALAERRRRVLATPHPDDVAPSGIELARMFARELSDVGNMVDADRAPVKEPTPSIPRYLLGERLGQRSIAQVFRGTLIGAEGFARDVAIRRALAGAPERAEMFIDDALLASQLVHPNIVQVFDFDRDGEGHHFLVMELVDGTSLDSLRDTGPLPPSMINFIMTETLRGLGYAHDLLAVHGKLCLRDVLLSWQGAVKLSDFTALGGPLDARSDLFAVGAMMRKLLSGQPHVPPDLEAVAMKLLERDPGGGYATAEQAIADLVSCRDVARDGRGELVRLLAERCRGVVARTVVARSRIPYLVASIAVTAAGWLAACSY